MCYGHMAPEHFESAGHYFGDVPPSSTSNTFRPRQTARLFVRRNSLILVIYRRSYVRLPSPFPTEEFFGSSVR
jgi:hypothetical protein